MTDPTTPVDRLRAEITERLDRVTSKVWCGDAETTGWIVEGCERDLRVLARHAPTGNGECCRHCCSGEHTRFVSRVPFPCPDLTDLADEYGVDLTGGTDG